MLDNCPKVTPTLFIIGLRCPPINHPFLRWQCTDLYDRKLSRRSSPYISIFKKFQFILTIVKIPSKKAYIFLMVIIRYIDLNVRQDSRGVTPTCLIIPFGDFLENGRDPWYKLGSLE